MSGFRFSSSIFGLTSRDEFAAMCRRAESHGYDTIFAVDHLGDAAPFQAVVAAAAATERLRVGTLVVNVPFWNPALLAREIATADILTGGRRDLVLPLTRAAIAVGADGVIIDVHPEPKLALCDGDQALVDADIRQIASIAANLSPLMGRTLTPALPAARERGQDRQPRPVAG